MKFFLYRNGIFPRLQDRQRKMVEPHGIGLVKHIERAGLSIFQIFYYFSFRFHPISQWEHRESQFLWLLNCLPGSRKSGPANINDYRGIWCRKESDVIQKNGKTLTGCEDHYIGEILWAISQKFGTSLSKLLNHEGHKGLRKGHEVLNAVHPQQSSKKRVAKFNLATLFQWRISESNRWPFDCQWKEQTCIILIFKHIEISNIAKYSILQHFRAQKGHSSISLH